MSYFILERCLNNASFQDTDFVALLNSRKERSLPGTIGPFDIEELLKSQTNKWVTDDPLIWQEGWKEWKRVSEVFPKGLEAQINEGVKEEVPPPADSETCDVPLPTNVSRNSKKRGAPARENTAVYVTGLEANKAVDESLVNDFAKHMSRAGVIKRDIDTLSPKITIYQNNGVTKGDALVVYLKPESISLAIKYLDGSLFRDSQIHVEEATQQQPTKKKKDKSEDARIRRQKMLAAKTEEERLLSWASEEAGIIRPIKSSSKGPTNKLVLIRYCWTKSQADKYSDTSVFYSIIRDLIMTRMESFKLKPKQVVPITRHPMGVVCVKMNTIEDASSLQVLGGEGCFGSLGMISLDHKVYLPEDRNIKSPLEFIFYDGKSNLKAQCLPPTQESSTMSDYEVNLNDLQCIGFTEIPEKVKLDHAEFLERSGQKADKHFKDEGDRTNFEAWLTKQEQEQVDNIGNDNVDDNDDLFEIRTEQ